MSKAKQFHTRRHQRLNRMRMRSGKRITTHRSKGGRTGKVFSVYLKSLRAN